VASKKSASKRAAKKSPARRSATPISEKDRRSAARGKAYELYGEQLNAIMNVDIADVAANLAELQKILARNNCTTADICNYLKKLTVWLIWFQADYTKLRRAVCNVERRAWGGPGDPSLRFCTNGPGSEPADPTPPPIWS
jgi:hypothetical protein